MSLLNLERGGPLTSGSWPPPVPAGKRDLSLPGGLLGASGSGQGFAAAKYTRLTADFLRSQRSADQDLFQDNKRLRARARSLALDNPFAKKFMQMVGQNVVGHKGVMFQAKVKNAYGQKTDATKAISLRIEAAFARWSKRGSCTADGRHSFRAVQLMAMKTLAAEGEVLVKKAFRPDLNACGFALQPLDNDQLDDNLMLATGDGNQVRMGVEVDRYRRPVAYHLFDEHPYDIMPGSRHRRRIPADQILHSFVQERPGQTRGYSHMAASMLSMKMYDGLNEATLVAARASAAKFAVIERAAADGFTGEDEDADGNTTNADGTQFSSANAGEIMEIEAGERFKYIDPAYPTQAFAPFSRTAIRNMATGVLVSYPSLGNDLEGVNFSSIRAGLLDERDSWRILQAWFIEEFLNPVYSAWVAMAQLTVLKDLNLAPEQWEQISWKPRGWPWVDPLKDAQATVLRLQNGFTTYADELGEMGRDFEETVDERAAEADYIREKGIILGTDIHGVDDTATDSGPAAPPSTTKPAAAKPAAPAKPPAKPQQDD